MKNISIHKKHTGTVPSKKNRYWCMLILLLISLIQSCIYEESIPHTGTGEVLVQLKMPIAATSIQDIDITHEDEIESLEVLVFEPGGDFIELLHAEEFEQDPISRNPVYIVEIEQGTYDFVFLANSKNIIETNYPTGISPGATRASVIQTLQLTIQNNWITDNLETGYIAMPMWGERNNVTVASGGVNLRGSDMVPMLRMTARIDVIIDRTVTALNQYRLHSVRLYNRRKTGQVIPSIGNYNFTYTAPEWNFTILNPSIPTNNPKIKEPLYYDIPVAFEDAYQAQIYTFETEAADPSADMLDYTCLVLGIGKESNPGGGVTRAYGDGTLYYRVDFTNSNSDYLPLLRNHQYIITVTDIINEGFTDPDKAYRSQLYNIDFQVQAWETHSEEVEMPGTYRLDISSTYIDLPSDRSAAYVTVTTTHPDGWSAYLSAYPDKIELPADFWVHTLFAVDDSNNLIFSTINMPAEKTFQLWVETNPVKEDSYAYIHVISGNLTNVIKVKRAFTIWV